MRRVIAIAFVFVLVFSFQMNIQDSSLSFVAPAVAADSEEEEGEHADYEYFEMDPLLIPIINQSGLSQQISLVVAIEVPYGKLEEVQLYRPRLADAYIQDLYGVLSAGYGLVNGNVLNVNAIKSRLSDVTIGVLGEENVHDVLLQVVQQRPL